MSVGYLDRKKQELEAYSPELTRRDDFEVFWSQMRRESDSVPLDPHYESVPYPCGGLEVQSVSYCGFDETRIHGWFITPVGLTQGTTIPCVVTYPGFNGNRGTVSSFAHWILAGAAVLSVDVREQRGITGNMADYTHGNATSVTTKGLLDKREYYYGAVYMDCLKAIDLAASQPLVDPERIIVAGVSQGGGLATAVSALDERPCCALVDVPSNSNLERRSEIKLAPYSGTGAFGAVNEYLRVHPGQTDLAFETLSYFDTMNMAEWITAPTVAAVGLDDTVCPAECYYATFNRIPALKHMTVYPFAGHGDVSRSQVEVQLSFLCEQGIIDSGTPPSPQPR